MSKWTEDILINAFNNCMPELFCVSDPGVNKTTLPNRSSNPVHPRDILARSGGEPTNCTPIPLITFTRTSLYIPAPGLRDGDVVASPEDVPACPAGLARHMLVKCLPDRSKPSRWSSPRTVECRERILLKKPCRRVYTDSRDLGPSVWCMPM